MYDDPYDDWLDETAGFDDDPYYDPYDDDEEIEKKEREEDKRKYDMAQKSMQDLYNNWHTEYSFKYFDLIKKSELPIEQDLGEDYLASQRGSDEYSQAFPDVEREVNEMRRHYISLLIIKPVFDKAISNVLQIFKKTKNKLSLIESESDLVKDEMDDLVLISNNDILTKFQNDHLLLKVRKKESTLEDSLTVLNCRKKCMTRKCFRNKINQIYAEYIREAKLNKLYNRLNKLHSRKCHLEQIEKLFKNKSSTHDDSSDEQCTLCGMGCIYYLCRFCDYIIKKYKNLVENTGYRSRYVFNTGLIQTTINYEKSIIISVQRELSFVNDDIKMKKTYILEDLLMMRLSQITYVPPPTTPPPTLVKPVQPSKPRGGGGGGCCGGEGEGGG